MKLKMSKLTLLPKSIKADVMGIIQNAVIGIAAVAITLAMVFTFMGNILLGQTANSFGANATNAIQASLYNNGVLNIGLLIIAIFFGVILLVIRSFGGSPNGGGRY